MSASGLPQGFSIFQPTLGAQLQFFPAVGTQELDELIHAHLIGPASSQEKRATLALDFLEHAQMTGQSFKFYPVYAVAASPATSAASSFNTSPTTTSWDWSQTSRTASVSSRSSQQQHRVSKPTSPASRMRATDFSSLPGMKIMTKDGLDVTNSASRGSKTKEQRDHAHLMRIIKACDACKRKKIRCDPSHKKRAAATPAAPLASSSKIAKKARTSSPSTASPSVSPPQSASPPIMLDDFGSFSASPFDMDATFSFDALDTFDASLADAPNTWDEFIQYPPMADAEDYDFFADPESYLSSQSSDAGMATSRLSASMSPTHSGAPPERGPDGGRAESHTQLPDGAVLAASVSALQPWESQEATGDYNDFNLYSPGSTFSEDDRMLDIASSASGRSTNGIPSPTDSPRRPPGAASPDAGAHGTQTGEAATQSPFTRAQQAAPADRGHVQDATAGDIAGALSVLSRSDIVMRTNEQGQLIICCPPGTVVVNSSQASADAGVANVSTVNDSSSSSFYIPRELSESAVASVSSAAGSVDTSVATWLDHGEGGQTSPQVANAITATSPQSIPTQLVDGIGRSQSSRFVHRNTDLAQQQQAVGGVADAPLYGAAPATTRDGLAGLGVSNGLATGLSASSGLSASATGLAQGLATQLNGLASSVNGLAPTSPVSPVSAELSASSSPSHVASPQPSVTASPTVTSGVSVTASPTVASGLSAVASPTVASGLSAVASLTVASGLSAVAPSVVASGLSAVASAPLASVGPSAASSPVDILGGYVSDQSSSQPSHSRVLNGRSDDVTDGISDASASSPSGVEGGAPALSPSSSESGVDQSQSDHSSVAAPAPTTQRVAASSVAPATGRPVQDSESAFDVSQTAASTISQRDTTGIGRSDAGRDATTQSPVSAAELAVLMQTVVTRTLLAAAYAQSTKVAASSVRSKACREYAPRTRSTLAMARVAAIC